MTKHVSKFSVWRGVWLTGLGLLFISGCSGESTPPEPASESAEEASAEQPEETGESSDSGVLEDRSDGQAAQNPRTVGQTRGG